MKKVACLLLITFIIMILYAYLKNDGIYVLKNINNTELDWINNYAVYKTPFSAETIIETFKKSKDVESTFFSHNEYIEAVILVPNALLDEIVPEFARNYDLKNSLDLRNVRTDEKIQYNVWIPRTVSKWLDKSQRNINYTVMQPNLKYTRVYIFADKLGWN